MTFLAGFLSATILLLIIYLVQRRYVIVERSPEEAPKYSGPERRHRDRNGPPREAK